MVTNLVGDLGACYVPIALLMAGYTIAEYPLGDMFNRPRSYIFAGIRLVIIPVVMLLTAVVFGLPESVATLVLLAFACPSGINVVVFPASYGKDCKTGASIVLISSLAAIVTVPLLYAFLQCFYR